MGKASGQCFGNRKKIPVPAGAGSEDYAGEPDEKLFSGKLDDTVLFAFDDIRDRDVIERKLDLLNRAVPVHKRIKFYVLCGFDRAGLWKPDFWGQDIRDTLERARILMRYKCLAYIMRYEKCWQSPYRGMYITISRWCNQPAQYAKRACGSLQQNRGEQRGVSVCAGV